MQNGGNYRGNSGGYPSQNRGYQQYDSQQPYGQKRDQSANGAGLKPINYDNMVPFRKDFYTPSELSRNRSMEDSKVLSAKYEISLVGRDSNKYPPVANFSDVGFPDFIMHEIARQGFTQPTGIQAAGFPVRYCNCSND